MNRYIDFPTQTIRRGKVHERTEKKLSGGRHRPDPGGCGQALRRHAGKHDFFHDPGRGDED